MLTRLDLALTTEVVVPMVTEGGAVVATLAATVAVDPGEESSEDISSLGCLKMLLIPQTRD